MATNENVKSYASAAEMVNYWITNMAPRYFEMDNVNTYRAGTLGLLNDMMGTTTEDMVHGMMVARREFYPNTAQYMKSLYRHAAAREMQAPMATPATATILLMIQQSDILKYGEQNENLHTFVLDDTFIAYVDDIPFMLDYPVEILSVQKENGKYAHTTHYDFYINNSLSTSNERYLPNKVMNYKGTDYLIIAAKMRQIYKTYLSSLVTSNSVVNTVTMDFSYDGTLANFEVFYRENDASARVQLEKYLVDSTIPKVPFCWYQLVDEGTIRLTFPANAYFVPRLNSTIEIEIATTLGTGGNFDSYESDIVSENSSTRYSYNSQVPIFGTVDGASTGGKDLITKEEFRTQVMRAYATNHSYITVNDLQLYFDQLMEGTNDKFKFVKKRDDAFIRLYGAFLLMKDSANNVVPTNTLDVELDPLQDQQDFDLYSEAVKRFIIKPGALFTYKKNEDDKYVIKRVHGIQMSDDLSGYDSDAGQYVCSQCGYHYAGDDFSKEPAEYVCPKCGAEKAQFTDYKFIFTNPYLISVSIDNFMAGYYMNSCQAYHDLSYTAVNDDSIVQFIAKNFKIERNAIAGENFYRFSVIISPSVEVNDETIFVERDDNIVALHNGYVKSIEHDGTAVYATIEYTDDPTISTDIPENEKTETIQVSSYIEKVDDYFYVCPKCGYRMTVDEWNAAKENNFLDENGEPMECPDCPSDVEDGPTLISNLEYTYVDFDYFPGYDLQFEVGDHITKNDVLAIAKPKDLGRIRLIMDLNELMASQAHRYIPFTLEEAHAETSTNSPYYVFRAYITTDDMIDSSSIMQIQDGIPLQDGSDGHTHPISIPIDGLSMSLHAFYQYREDDGLSEATRNPAHEYSSFAYVAGYTFTNTYELFDDDTITLTKSLDNARGFLDAIERPSEGGETPDPDPEPEPDPDHPPAESGEHPMDPNTIYLRTHDHMRFKVVEDQDDRYDGRYLTLDKEKGSDEPYEPEEPEKPEPEPPDTTYPPAEGEYGSNFLYRLRNCPVVSANWIKVSTNEDLLIERLASHYDEIEQVIWNLENAFGIDMKFYNTYGKSKFYKIGSRQSLSVLDSVNITLNFGIAVNFPITVDVFRDNFRTYIKEQIEATDEMVGNGIDLYIMNVIAGAKANFDEILYMEYYGLNNYDYSAQRITIMSDDEILATVKADSFVPEFLNIIRETVNGTTRPKIGIQILNNE